MYALDYIVQCEVGHLLFAVLWCSGPLVLTWTILTSHTHVRPTWPLLAALGFALACTSHYAGDMLGFPF